MGRIESGKVTGQEVKSNRDATRQERLLQVELTAPEDVQTVELMSQTGEESNPPVGSKVTVVSVGEAWKLAVASSDKITPSIAPGEKKIYSTNEAGDTITAQVHCKNDGTVIINNDEAVITITPSGVITIINTGNTEITSAKTIINNDVEINGNTVINGNLQWTGNGTGSGGGAARVDQGLEITNGSVTHNGTNIGDTHNHPQDNDSNGDTEQDTGGPQ